MCDQGQHGFVIGEDLDEHEPRKAMPPSPLEEQQWSISVPPLPVPREMKETIAPGQVAWSPNFEASQNVNVPVGRFEKIDENNWRFVSMNETSKRGLAGNSAERKSAPVYEGVMCYFPNALVEVARVSKMGNDKHNPGQPLHWSFNKSTDHGDCIARHQLEAEDIDTSDLEYERENVVSSAQHEGVLHAAKVAWRALAQLETLLLNKYPELKPGKNVKGFVR